MNETNALLEAITAEAFDGEFYRIVRSFRNDDIDGASHEMIRRIWDATGIHEDTLWDLVAEVA